MNVATVAMDTVWMDPSANIELTEKHVSEVLKLFPNTQIILFPEISLMGTVEGGSDGLAESMDGSTVKKIQEIAQKQKVALICGIIEKNPSGKPYNTSFVVSKDGLLVTSYRKNHLFTQSREPEFYSPGQELTTFDFEGWKCGLSTCFDIRFPRLFETYKKADVECVFSGFNWIEDRNKPEIMKSLVKARAHENQNFMVTVDRSGSDPNHNYYGISVIANPYAEDIAKREEIYSYAELNKEDITTLANKLPLSGSFRESYKLS